MITHISYVAFLADTVPEKLLWRIVVNDKHQMKH